MDDARLPTHQQPTTPPSQQVASSPTTALPSPPLLDAPQDTIRVSDQTVRPTYSAVPLSPTPKPEPTPPAATDTHVPHGSKRWQIIAYYATGGVLVAWSVYTVVRYAIAITEHADDVERWRYAIAFTALSAVALVMFVVGIVSKLVLPRNAFQFAFLAIASVTLLIPTLFNLAFVTSWRTRSPARSTLSLVGRCDWHLDIVWSGRAGQCPENPVSWGVWLSEAILRFLITLGFIVIFIVLSWSLRNVSPSAYRSSPRPRPRPHSHSTAMLVGGSASNSTNKLRRKSRPSDPLSPDSSSSTQDHHRRTFSSSNQTHNQATITYIPNILSRPPLHPATSASNVLPPGSYGPTPTSSPPRRRSSESNHVRLDSVEGRLSPTSDISEYYSDVDDGGDLNRFAHNFRNLVERVSRETEDASRLPSPATSRPSATRQNTPPSYASRRTPSPRSSLSTDGDLQRDLLQAHRIMLLEQAMRAESYEHVLVLGGAVRRMSTIPSLADGEREPPWTPTSGTSTYATPRELTRSPTTSTARSGRRNPMARHAISPTPPPLSPNNGRFTPPVNGNGHSSSSSRPTTGDSSLSEEPSS